MKPITYEMLSDAALAQVRAIQPSCDRAIAYYPCQARLNDGTTHECVYVVDATAYERIWGVISGRSMITAAAIISLEDSTHRLPRRFADQLYAAGESGMGYCVFTLRFHDGSSQAYMTGNAVDFLPYPGNQSPETVVAVLPHVGRELTQMDTLAYDWCLVRGLDDLVR